MKYLKEVIEHSGVILIIGLGAFIFLGGILLLIGWIIGYPLYENTMDKFLMNLSLGERIIIVLLTGYLIWHLRYRGNY